MKRIQYIDSFSTGSFHVQINACLLKMLMMLYPHEVAYHSSSSNKKEVVGLVPELEGDIEWNKLFVYEGKSKYAILFRYIFSAFLNIIILLRSKNNQVLVFNYNNPFSIRTVNCLNKILRRKILIVCHGELERLYPKEDSGFLAKLITFFVRNFFQKEKGFDSHITFCVLGESVLHNLKDVISPELYKHFHVIEHPYIYSYPDTLKQKIHEDGILNLGVVGSFSYAKGGRSFIQLVEEFNDDTNVRFSVTGSVSYGGEELKSLGVSFPKNDGKGQIPIEEFSERISQLDYILFLYPSDSYKLTASGAIMDAIKWGKPIISIRNDYFENIFRKYGEFGFLVNDFSEMKDKIRSLIKTQMHSDYDFDSIRQNSSPESISIQMKRIVDQVLCG